MEAIIRVLIWAVPIVFSIVIHEVAHGWMAYRLGDQTAKRMGRLTLNPIPHIDPLGTVILPFILLLLGGPVFGWAKPVPFNPLNFSRHINVRKGTMWVAFAGPGSNLILAFVASFVLVFLRKFLSPLHPLMYTPLYQLAYSLVIINLVLGVLNLMPIPPLDGSKIFVGFLPQEYVKYFLMLERYGLFIIFIMLGSGIFSHVIPKLVESLFWVFLLIPRWLFYGI